MSQPNQKFWPFKPQGSIISAIALLVGLLLLMVILRSTTGWLSEESEATVMIGVIVVSLLPVLLAILDIVIEQGGVIGIKDIKIDFSQVTQQGMENFNIPVNIGVRGAPVSDSDTTQILDALRGATSCDAAIIDLEDGQAWWETRLLVLLAGAERLKKPAKIIFVATEKGKEHQFQGWAHSDDLLWRLVQANFQYLRSLQASRAAAKQWELVEPIDPVNPGVQPIQPVWITGGLASQHSWMAFDGATGLPNELLAEQLLAADLGQKIEMHEGSKSIDLIRLEELFRPLLVTEYLDLSWPTDKQISTVFDSEHTYISVVEKGRYSTLIAKTDVMNQMMRSMIEKKRA